MPKKIKVLCAMSGGVDSAVAASLLKQNNYDIVGVFMKLWSEQSFSGNINESFRAAKKTAHILNIPLYTADFTAEFKNKIIDNFLSEYSIGKTPNPCVRCNKFIKFGLLFEQMKKYGARYVATGHYARVATSIIQPINPPYQGGYENSHLISGARGVKKISIKLLKAKDENKDQSYFLYNLTQKKLKKILFPIGGYAKQEVRELAKKFKLPVQDSEESQEVCFEKEVGHYNFLRCHLKSKKGDIITVNGDKIGEHKGLPFYTIGQRKGIEIGGTGPYYVVELDFKNNKLIVADTARRAVLARNFLICKEVNWVSGQIPKLPLKCKARLRYRQKEADAKVSFAPQEFLRDNPIIGATGRYQPLLASPRCGIYLVKFATPQLAITAGQSVVFYKQDEVLGGGIIV